MRGRKNHVHLNLVHNNQLKRWNDKTKTPNSELREWKVTGFNIPIAAIRIIVIRLFSEIHTRAESFVKKGHRCCRQSNDEDSLSSTAEFCESKKALYA